MPSKWNVKYTIGKEGAGTPGTPVARTIPLPIRDIGSLDRDLNKIEDPIIVGQGMAAGEFAASADTKGSLDLTPRADAGWGSVLKGAFGTEAAPSQVIGVVRIRYTGSSASCKITTDVSGKTINAKIGALGSESNDAAFGTSGTLTLTDGSVDTLAELVAVIEAYADYSATLVTGSGASTITSVVSATMQAKGKFAYIFLTGTSGAYVHKLTLNLTAGSELPTWSIQRDGFQDNYLYDGVVVDKLSMSAALKGALEATVELLGMKETGGQVASAVTPTTAKPLIFGGGFVSLGGQSYDYCRKMALNVARNHLADGYGQAALDRAYHQKGVAAVDGSLSLRLDATSVLERAKTESGSTCPVQFQFIAAEAKKVGTSSVAEMMIIECAASEVSSFKPEANGDQIDAAITFKAFNPATATDYDAPVTVWLIDANSSEY